MEENMEGTLSSTMNESNLMTPRSYFKGRQNEDVQNSLTPIHEAMETPDRKVQERRDRLLNKLNCNRKKSIETIEARRRRSVEVEEENFVFAVPNLPPLGNVDLNRGRKDEAEMLSLKAARLASMERRDAERKRKASELKIIRLASNETIDLNKTEIKFIEDSFTAPPHITQTIMENSSTPTLIEDEFGNEDRQNETLCAWINELLGQESDTCKDVEEYATKAKKNADKLLKNLLTKGSSVVIEGGLDSSSFSSSKRMENWLAAQNKAVDILKNLKCIKLIQGMIRTKDEIIPKTNVKPWLDTGLQIAALEMLLSYHPVWLRLALETIFGVDLAVKDYSSAHSVFTTFISKNVFCDQKILNQRKYATQHTKVSATPAGCQKLMENFLDRMLSIVMLIEEFQRNDVINPHNPPMFVSGSSIKSSGEIINWMSKEVISAKTSMKQILKNIEFVQTYKQSYGDEFNYFVSNIGCDLCDGFVLGRIMEVVCNVKRNSIVSTLRPPGNDRIRKLGNVRAVLHAASLNGLQLEKVKAEDVVGGKVNVIVEMMWKIIGVYVGKTEELEKFRAQEKRAADLKAEYERLRIQNEKIAEEKRIAEEEQLRMQNERIAEENRIYEENKRFEEQRLAEEKRLAEENKRLAEEKRIAEEKRLAEEMRVAEEERIAGLRAEKEAERLRILNEEILKERVCAASVIQKCWRANVEVTKAKEQLNKLRQERKLREVWAVNQISVFWVNILNIRRAKKLLSELAVERSSREQSAITLQRYWRGIIQMRYAKLALEKLVDQKLRRNQAATTIQRCWWNFLNSKQSKVIIAEEKLRRVKAAFVIQSFWRNCLEISKAKQKLLRLKEIAKENLIKYKAAVLLQSQFRKIMAIRKMKKMKEDKRILLITDIVFDAMSRISRRVNLVENKRRNRAATIIQSVFRGYLSRKINKDIVDQVRKNMERIKEEVRKNLVLDVSDMELSVHNRFDRISMMLKSGKKEHYKGSFESLARLLRYTPALGFYFAQVSGHVSLVYAMGSLHRGPEHLELSMPFSEILHTLLSYEPSANLMKSEFKSIAKLASHYMYAHHWNETVVYNLGRVLLLLKSRNCPQEAFEKMNFYLKKLDGNFKKLDSKDKRKIILGDLQKAFT
uniref:Calponin-homology (CH) domain-containing protein n=1 Tax=Rhabditophanes sp. KR3021 TaxID=114890 RepID=A0AC35TRP0_9BILA